jgi:EAL domain-containing protein (putative c-di-GMP-specific phosphodiesterase class I)
MVAGDENREIVHTIIRLAQNLKKKVIAEGVETAEQVAHLATLGCEYGQGYYFSKPLEAESVLDYIRERSRTFNIIGSEKRTGSAWV